MLMGHADSLPEFSSQKDLLVPEHLSDPEEDEEADSPSQILYMASFDELAGSYIQYDTIIWLSISLMLVLAWGIGVIMLLYLPIKRYVLQKDISSRKLYVTPTEIVYKVLRPSFLPCWKVVTIEKRVPLSLVIDIIIEQGCLQSIFGLHTFRIESISRGKAAPVDELQVQGVSNPGLLRKVIITEASKVIQDVGRTVKLAPSGQGELTARMGSLTEGPSMRYPSKNWKVSATVDQRRVVHGDLLLHKLDEVNKSVKTLSIHVSAGPETFGPKASLISGALS